MVYGIRKKFLGTSPDRNVDLRYIASTSVDNTVSAMREMVEKFYQDLAPFADWDLESFFDYVKELPYHMEEKDLGLQVLQRPIFTLKRIAPYVACANKAILIGSFLKLKGIPYGFVVSSDDPRKNYGHVFNWAKLGSRRVIIDATYPHNVIFREKKYPKRKIFK